MSTSGTHGNAVVNGFTVVRLKVKKDDKAVHHLFLKQHRVRERDKAKPEEKTLFVVNIPPYCTKESLKQAFSQCGRVCHVYLHERPTAAVPSEDKSKYFPSTKQPLGFKVAYIVFYNSEAVTNARELSFDDALVLQTDKTPVLTGLEKWCQEYENSIVDVDEMQKEIDSFMAEFDTKMEQEKEKAKETEGVPDEDNWVTVSRHGHKGAAPRSEKTHKKFNARARKKRKEKELLNFYSFQVKESKQQEIVTLRQKFEEDKQRIAVLKASRKFRPY